MFHKHSVHCSNEWNAHKIRLNLPFIFSKAIDDFLFYFYIIFLLSPLTTFSCIFQIPYSISCSAFYFCITSLPAFIPLIHRPRNSICLWIRSLYSQLLVYAAPFFFFLLLHFFYCHFMRLSSPRSIADGLDIEWKCVRNLFVHVVQTKMMKS